MGKLGKMPRSNDDTPVLYRVASFETEQANDDERSIPLVLASETPVSVYDRYKKKVLLERLDMRGCDLPRQMPLLDTHNAQNSIRSSVLGSLRDFQIQGDCLRAVAYFSKRAEDVYEMYRDGVLTDFSVGAKRIQTEMSRDGNMRYVRKWKPFEGSAVIRGADPRAKAELMPALRAYFEPLELLEEEMDTKLREALVKRGMPADLENNDVINWLEENFSPEPDASEKVKREYTEILSLLRGTDTDLADDLKRRTDATDNIDREEVAKDALKRYEQIDDLCRKHKVDDKQRKEWLHSDISPESVAGKILERLGNNGDTLGQDRVEITKDRREKTYAAMLDGLVQRAVRGQVDPEDSLAQAKRSLDADAIKRNEELMRVFTTPADGADQFRNSTLSDMARIYLEEAGVDCRRLTRNEVCQRALRHRGLFDDDIQREEGAYHTTGSFSNLMLDAANKTLLAAYDEAPTTYQMWVRQAPSAPDFKDLNRIRFGELADPDVVPENFPYPEKSTSDAKESYAVDKYGEIFSISWEAMVNDDLNAISRIPAMQGNAMRRKINKVCYAILTDNDTLSDGVALFHATSHGANLDTNTLAVSALDTGYTVMRTQTGLSGSGTPLNIQPRYLIVPAALEASAFQIIGSVADPSNAAASTEDASRPNFNSGTLNIYGPNGPRRLIVVADAQLDDDSTSAWYLAADTRVVDTVEITFLQGYESPVLSRMEGFDVDTMKYKITQPFAAKAIDYRGLYQGNT